MKLTRKHIDKLVAIGWEDSQDMGEDGTHWIDPDKLTDLANERAVVVSIGWLVAINDKRVLIASDKTTSNKYSASVDYWGRVIRIPLPMVEFAEIIKRPA